MSPVMEGYIKYKDLFDGSLTLFDLLNINEAISYKNDIEHYLYNKNEDK